jgi:tetratricopeptide (TPR) repeat protein
MGHSESAVYGKRAIAQAVKLEDHASETDKLYIEAAQVDASSKEHSKRSANKKEIAILQELVRKSPADQQAHLYLALALMDGYNDNGEPKRGQQEGMAVLEGNLRGTPNDSAANHYWIHSVEPGNHPEQAIASAALLASLAPNSGHMVHMPGHIYYRVGNYLVAEHWFAASMATDERYMHEQHVAPDDDWNYAHNMMYAIANMMEQGRLSDANTLSDHLAAARGHLSASLYIWSARDQVSRISHRLPVALRVGDWDAVLTMLNQAKISDTKKTANLRFLATGLTEYATGMKALESRNIAVAQSTSAQLDADLARVKLEQAAKHKDDAKSEKAKDGKENKKEPPMVPISPDALSGPLVKCMAIQSLELRAGILLAQGKTREAKKLYSQAIKDEKKLGYHEPPFYIRPVAETEAAAFLQAKDFKAAQAAYEAALVERPNSGFGLYGLALSKELSGDATGARNTYQIFLKAWSNADPGLPEVARARKVLSTDTQAAR